MSHHLMFQSFLAVYRTGSQTKAAAELSLTQPAISQHIKNLEMHLQKTLFRRVGKFLEPTALAHQLAFSIGSHVDILDNIWNAFKPKSLSQGGIVYLGGIAEFFATALAPYISSLNEHKIQIRFEIGREVLLEKLLQGELDLAQFCTHVVHPGITIERLFHQEYYLVGSPQFIDLISEEELKRGDTRSIDALPWVAYDESLLFIKEYFQTVFNKSFSGHIALMIKDLWSIEAAVAGGLGITVLPSYFCQEILKNKKLVILHYPKNHPNHYFYLGWKDGALHNNKIKVVRQLLLKAASNKSL
ncbi:LysR family transcriptional regulator [Legionella fallonii]|uniref:Putative Transcriptional regulator, LysR family n=1 Tax=Legionella fallonii LLAP-10 TaxID=1212491 RepID=A0A098G4A8_9GAMM|nr:LysR family transcriptional regulator [Legionella fallonii]CEG57328.1 putative Transcriptional regulator, LysR family [Legionella fallonii LLAP-10]